MSSEAARSLQWAAHVRAGGTTPWADLDPVPGGASYPAPETVRGRRRGQQRHVVRGRSLTRAQPGLAVHGEVGVVVPSGAERARSVPAATTLQRAVEAIRYDEEGDD